MVGVPTEPPRRQKHPANFKILLGALSLGALSRLACGNDNDDDDNSNNDDNSNSNNDDWTQAASFWGILSASKTTF